jgi:D-lactate dehydrogenase
VEFQEPAGADITAIATRAARAVHDLSLIEPARFTSEAAEQALLWRIRKGMFPSVGAVRRRGTTVIIEDVAFPVPDLANAVVDLQALFIKHGYDDAIIFGHAKDGNLHFVLTQAFNDRASIDQYARFIDDVVALVVTRYDGALKAEHGTGRNMAPFVEAEWGREAYAVMREVKALVDPEGLLNPGVIINPDPQAHLADLKSLPAIEEEVDRCIECGFCEPHCPSRDLTLTPRQRIVVRREMARTPASAARLAEAFEYDGLDTCAADGLCAVACPVHIDTGHLTKRLRAVEHSALARAVASWTARHFAATERVVRIALGAARMVGGVLPASMGPLPAPASRLPDTRETDAEAIYFPSCITRSMGPLAGEDNARSTADAFVAVAARAGVRLAIPRDIHGLCCGTPYSSKGFTGAHAVSLNRAIDVLWDASRRGELPVVVDTSPCTYGLQALDGLTAGNRSRAARMQIVDAVDFFATRVVPRLQIRRTARTVTLHPVCSLTKMGLVPRLSEIASACSERVFVPPSSGCCGFAGDRGWLVPELTASATAAPAAEVRGMNSDGYYSSSRTCEIGMTRATGEVYRSWIHLLDWSTEDET